MVGKIKSLTTLSNAVVVLKLKSLVNTSVHFKDLLGVEVFMELNRILSVSRNLKINQLQLKKDSQVSCSPRKVVPHFYLKSWPLCTSFNF